MDCTDHHKSYKILPSKSMKLKRLKEGSYFSSHQQVKSQINNSLESGAIEDDGSDRSVSSPDSACQDSSYRQPSLQISTQISELSPNKISEAADFVENFDEPLDMSCKPQVTATQISCSQTRPSVITCASALLKNHCTLSDLAHKMCTAKVNDVNCEAQDLSVHSEKDTVMDAESKIAKQTQRTQILSGSFEPVIDEHFRRSLGEDYKQIFAKPPEKTVSLTVDDHFAKALGDTWHRIRQSKSLIASPRLQ